MRVGIAGSGGSLGRALERELRAAGHEVVAIDPALVGGSDVGASDVGAAPSEHERADGSAALVGCEAVVAVGSRLGPSPRETHSGAHLVAPFSAGALPLTDRDHEAAAEAAIGPLADGALDAGVRRFLLISTTAVYGMPAHLPCAEGDWKRPRSDAARRAWALERRVFARHADRGLPLSVLRPALVYGPEVRGPVGWLAAWLAVAGARGRPATVRGGPVLHLVHVDDVAAAARHLLEHRFDDELLGRPFHVADETPLRLGEVATIVSGALGLPTPRRLPYPPRLLRVLAWLLRTLPESLLAEPLARRMADGFARLARRDRLSRALVPRLDADLLDSLGADHYFDTSRLAALGFQLRQPAAAEGLARTVEAWIRERWLPSAATSMPRRP